MASKTRRRHSGAPRAKINDHKGNGSYPGAGGSYSILRVVGQTNNKQADPIDSEQCSKAKLKKP